MDVVRRGGEVLIRVDIPGVDPDSLDVTVDGRVLTIAATRESDDKKGDVVYRRGRTFGAVRQQITLSDNVDVDHVAADYDNGALTIRIPVAEHVKARRVAIQSGKAGAKEITQNAG